MRTLLEEITAYLHAELDAIDGLPAELHQHLVILANNYARGMQRQLSTEQTRMSVALAHLRGDIANDAVLAASDLPQHLKNRATEAVRSVVLLLLGNVQ